MRWNIVLSWTNSGGSIGGRPHFSDWPPLLAPFPVPTSLYKDVKDVCIPDLGMASMATPQKKTSRAATLN